VTKAGGPFDAFGVRPMGLLPERLSSILKLTLQRIAGDGRPENLPDFETRCSLAPLFAALPSGLWGDSRKDSLGQPMIGRVPVGVTVCGTIKPEGEAEIDCAAIERSSHAGPTAGWSAGAAGSEGATPVSIEEFTRSFLESSTVQRRTAVLGVVNRQNEAIVQMLAKKSKTAAPANPLADPVDLDKLLQACPYYFAAPIARRDFIAP
jgi:hypothetical protein